MQLDFLGDNDNPEYEAFLDKFKGKKTTDDCYTPEGVYNAVAEYVRRYYGLEGRQFVRPFWPGGDFERYPYEPGDVVVDNPPFSMMRKIMLFYQQRGIPFFLFSPGLTIGTSTRLGCTFIGAGVHVTYENGANVNTGFVTNMEPDVAARSAPDLREAVEKAAREYERTIRKQLPKYTYPEHVLTAARLNYMSTHGQAFTAKRDASRCIQYIDSQRAAGKTIFGGALLLSDRAAQEHAEAESAAAKQAARERETAERTATTEWGLSDRERAIIREMSKEG